MPRADAATARVPAADRRLQYLQVAADLVIEEGAAAVTMDAVAAGAGVNKSLLYRQFANRGELLLALHQRETAELDARIAAAMEAVETFEEKITAFVHAWFSHMVRRGRLMYRLLDARTVAERTVGRPSRERQRNIDRTYGQWYVRHFGLREEDAIDAAAVHMAGLTGLFDRWLTSPTAATRQRLEATFTEIVAGSLERLQSKLGTTNDTKTNGTKTNGATTRRTKKS